MGIGSKIKDAKRIFSQDGSFEAVNSRISNLETHEYKITYYEVVSGTSGTLTVPSQGTINADEFGLSGNAILSKIDVNGKPTFESPVTSGGSPVTASLNVLTGAWVASGTYTDTNVALIYSIKINALYYDNLVYNNIIETVKVTADVGTTTLQSVTDAGNTTTNTIETAGYVKTGGTSSQFLKADGSVDSSVYITSSALTPYLTTASAASTYYPIPTGTTSQYLRGDGTLASFPTIPSGTVTSVDLTMPSAFTVSGNPVTNSGTLAVTGAGIVSQYIRGDGTLANFPTSTGGGSSVSYYLNGSVDQGTIGGIAFKEVNKTPVIGAGTDFTINANGYIQSFITDANDPNQLTIPAGNWNFETYFSASSGGGSPSFYVELYKWDGTTLTLIASNSTNPEYITNGTAIDLYISALAVPQTTLTSTDRLAIRIYVTHSSRTIKLHTEDNHLCQIITTFSTGLTALNGLTEQVQSFGNDTNVTMVSSGSTHTLTWAGTLADSRIASASTWNAKQNALSGTGFVKSTAGVISYDTNTYLTTSSAASTYVPYTGANANVNLGVYELSTPKLNGSKINLIGTDNAFDGLFVSAFTYVNIPNLGIQTNTVSLSPRGFSLTTDGNVLTGSYVNPFGIGMANNRNEPLLSLRNSTGSSILIQAGNVGIFTPNPQTALQVAGNITTTWADSIFGTWYTDGSEYRLGFNTVISQRQTNIHAYTVDTGGYITFSTGTVASPFVNFRINPKQTSGALSNFVWDKPNNTGQTASTSIAGFNYFGGTRQWATGAITTQSENVWGATTYSFVGASTITNAYGNVFNAPVAGTNATITNNFSAQFNGRLELTSTSSITLNNGTDSMRISRASGALGRLIISRPGNESVESVSFGGAANEIRIRQGAGEINHDSQVFRFVNTGPGGLEYITSAGNIAFRGHGSTTGITLFGATRNVTIQNGGTFTDNGYRLEVVGTSNFTDRVNIGNYASPSAQRMLTVGQDTAFVTIGSVPSSTSQGGIWINQTTPSANNAVVYATPTVTTFQSSGNLYLRANGANVALITQNNFSFSPYLTNAGASENFTFTKPNNTNQTLSTSIAGWNYNGGSRQWATGAITTQSENVWGAVTYSFVGASTITNAFGNVFNAPIAGTNCTITSNWAARFNGAIYVDSPTGAIFDNSAGSNIIRIRRTGGTIETIISATGGGAFIGSSTVHSTNIQSAGVVRMSFSGIGNGDCTFADGMKWICGSTLGNTFGSANTQKLAFWNATPIVQPANTTSLNGVLENTGLMASGSTISTINKPLVVGANTTPRTGVATDGVTSVLGNLQNFTTNYHSGEVLYNEVSGEALNFGQLCYRNAAGKWQKATGSSSTIAAYNMLGICLQTVGAVDTAISILTRGYVESTYLSAGAVGNPLFMDATTAGSITNTAPSTAGNVVRVIGNVFWSSALQTNSKWIVYFNPDNTWIEL